MKTAWVLLYCCSIANVAGTTFLKLSDGGAKISFAILSLLSYVAAFPLFALALKKIPLTLANTVSIGVTMVLVAIIGIYFFKEQLSFMKAVFIIIIITGVTGLNLCD